MTGDDPYLYSGSAVLRNKLGMLATSFRLEFPGPQFQPDQIEALANEITELVKSIGDAELPRSIKPTRSIKPVLLRHATFLAWAIRNIDIVGAEGGL